MARTAAAVRRMLWELLEVLRAVGAHILRVTGTKVEVV